jgi:hypothetical protein
MSDKIKPDLTLNMKREWFEKVWNGEKTVEYREVKPYWTRRIGSWVGYRVRFVRMVLGYQSNTPAILLQVYKVDVGPCPYPGWNETYYRLHFTIAGHFWKNGDTYIPMAFQKMKGGEQ